jgi:phage terminase large subunit-like protein
MEPQSKQDQIKELAENSLSAFIRLVAPKNVMGGVHEELCQWWTRQSRKSHQLVLLPRDHGKSRYIAYRVAWEITRRPWIRILYISSTSNLAEKQLFFIKQILSSPIYRRYWPEMVNEEEGKREKWTNTEISVDHPRRAEEGVRDPTVFIGGLTTNLVGMHCDVAVLDDTVTADTAYTDEGRNKLRSQYSLLSSIEGGDAQEWVVGTRYHPKDLYADMLEMNQEVYDKNGEEVNKIQVFEIFERQVEDRGDGTGEFLWPRQQRADGMWFGFDQDILARKRAKYLDKTQFRAQYYNDPNDPEDASIDRSQFQYYDKKHLIHDGGHWFYSGQRLNVFASVDFAYTTNARSDYTAIAVIGIDGNGNIYVLDIDRFKTSRISEMYDHILDLHVKWDFRKLAAETTSGQKTIVQELKDSYIKPNGIYLSIIEVPHHKNQGTKQERMTSILEPKYDNNAVWHYRGGNCQVLEDELVMRHPPHDDCKDALATAIEVAVPPVGMHSNYSKGSNVIYHKRFGGVAI